VSVSVSSAPPVLVDTHAHLEDEKFQDDLPAVLERARAAGVCRVVAVGITAATSLASVELAQRFPDMVVSAVGIHPNSAAAAEPGDWDRVLELVGGEGVVALGETGLDRHWNDTPFDLQEEYFARHLALARERSLPVVIHCRDCEADVVRMLRSDYDRSGPVRGVMHSFTGTAATAQSCLAMGLHISFAGMLTYKNAQELRDVAAGLPLDRLLVETDSPYLAPVPMRGKRNEPAFAVHTAAVLAGLHHLDVSTLAERTTANARALFGFRP
jgi:TatD DNase family protein